MIRYALVALRVVFAASMIALGAIGPAAGAGLRAFDAGSLDAIRAAHPGEAFVLAFWSTQCEPCREEMAMWKSIARKYPKLPVILVATDPPPQEQSVNRFLARYDPGPVERWAFADEFSERVRYSVDRTWRGELPRTYFYDAAHRPLARSGLLDQAWVENWIAAQRAGMR